MDAGVFDGPKPVRLLQRLLTLANLEDDSIALDFFSGSGTTGFASSPAKINVFEIFKLYMPESANEITKRVKVI